MPDTTVRGAPTTLNPGQQVNPRAPRVPRPSPGSLLQGGVSLGIGIAGEAAIDAAWDKVAPDREQRYRERTQDPRPLRPNYPEISGGIGAIGAGPIGVAGAAAAAAGRYLFPDDSDVGNPNGPLGRSLGWNDDYPNQTPTDAMGQGPQIEAPRPAQPGEPGGVVGAVYRVRSGGGQTYNPNTGVWSPIATGVSSGLTGPVSTQEVIVNAPVYSRDKIFTGALPGERVQVTIESNWTTGDPQIRGNSASLERADGGTDPPAVPEQPATYAPNPARSNRPTVPGGVPNLLPDPPIVTPGYDPAGDTPWPGAAPAPVPDTQPIAPAPATPPGFQPSAPAGAPSTPTNPNAPPGPTNPDPSAPPREAPPDLATDPDTPPKPAPTGGKQTGPNRWELPDGTIITDNPDGSRTIDSPTDSPWLDELHNPTRPLVPPVLPVPVPVGQVQPVRTPSSPRLTGNPADNPNVQPIQPPVRQTPTEAPKGTCFYEFQRVADIQRKATDTNQRAQNPVSGFPGLYGIGIESRLKIGESFTLLQQVNQFMRKAWEMTRMQKVLDVLTFIGVMHNVSMLSRDVGETFFQLISQGVQAVGIRDEEDNVIDVGQVVGNSVENLLKGILGEAVYNGIGEAWNKANRIISSASAIIWTVRSIADSSLDLMEWIGENTGRIGNALKRWGVVGERSYPWMSESARAQGRWRSRFSKVTDTLDNAEDRLSVYMQATSTVIEVQEETQELGEQWSNFRQSVEDGIPDPWADNEPIASQYAADQAVSDGPDVPPADAQKGS